MAGRSRLLTAILAVLVILIMVALSGCAVGSGALTRTKDGRYEYTEGTNVWIWDHKGGTEQITLNDKLFAVMQKGITKIALPDGRSLDVLTDSSGTPQSVKAAWGIVLTQADYNEMNTAFSVHTWAGSTNQTGSAGWAIFMLLVIAGGVLIFIYGGHMVNSWKLGGIFGGNDTAKSLLIVKAFGVLVMVVGVIILLAIIF